MNFLKKILSNIKSHYDKILALLLFAGLVASLLYLAVQVGLIKAKEKEFARKMAGLKPAKEFAEKIDTVPFETGRDAIYNPFLLDIVSWTNTPMYEVETRFWCVECRMPVPFEAKVCPHCESAIPIEWESDPEGDNDLDGIKNGLEEDYGLDSNDNTDAQKDFDGDGFTNYEELMADPVTDPKDAAIFPPIWSKVYLDAIGVMRFKLRFKSSIKMPDGTDKFGLNLQRGDRIKTYFVKMGEDVEGFTLDHYEVKERPDDTTITKDISELTLIRGDKKIVLIKNQDIQHDEYLARLIFRVKDQAPVEFVLSVGKTFELRSESYELILIDMTKQTVVIKRLSDGDQRTIHKIPADEGTETGANP